MNAIFIKRHRWKMLALVIAIALIALYPREKLDFVVSSPDASYRLEVYDPHWLLGMWLYHVKGVESPAIVRLVRNSDGAYLGESPVIDLAYGERPTWLIEEEGVVSLGTQYQFTNIPRSQ